MYGTITPSRLAPVNACAGLDPSNNENILMKVGVDLLSQLTPGGDTSGQPINNYRILRVYLQSLQRLLGYCTLRNRFQLVGTADSQIPQQLINQSIIQSILINEHFWIYGVFH